MSAALADLVGHVGNAIDVRDELSELLLGELINSLQESLGKLLGWRIPVESCRDGNVTLGEVATEVLGRDAANKAVEIGHGRRTFVCCTWRSRWMVPATVGHSH
jgi:hypothetical protein